MIETVEKINWRDELEVWSWGSELQKKVNAGEFRYTSAFEQTGVSDVLESAFRDLERSVSRNRIHTALFVAYLNSKIGKVGCVSMPDDGTDRYWVRINGLVMHFELLDEYEGSGQINSGLRVPYIDKNGDDDTWLALIDELSNAAQAALPGLDAEFVEQWAEYYE